MPFLTEEIWQELPHTKACDKDFLMLQDWPRVQEAFHFKAEEKAMELVMETVTAIRSRRAEMNVPPSRRAHLTVCTAEVDAFRLGSAILARLGYGSDVAIEADNGQEPAKGQVTVITHAARVFLPLAELVDLEKEKARLEKAIKKNQGELDKLAKKLSNPGFLAKAPEAVVKTEQERMEQLTALIAKLNEQAASL